MLSRGGSVAAATLGKVGKLGMLGRGGSVTVGTLGKLGKLGMLGRGGSVAAGTVGKVGKLGMLGSGGSAPVFGIAGIVGIGGSCRRFHHARVPLPLELTQDEPVYVKAKHYQAILSEDSIVPDSRLGTNSSKFGSPRHVHAN
ncbi:hypothetical protein V6N11_081178 [Hibiscus sabdariffa]|uniref:Uncharacterized protein n=1 Tax=Hibiscus sabdariffa TaxID=183260 RepID=A0ABR2QJ80_9ROSI